MPNFLPDLDVVMTRAEIGRAIGVTAARVYQIEREAIAKICKLIFETDDYPDLRELFEANQDVALRRIAREKSERDRWRQKEAKRKRTWAKK